MNTPKVSLILPAKNEADSLVWLLPDLKARFPKYELIVVDDGSTDSTSEIVRANGCKLLRHRYSKGNGAAIKAGTRVATGEVLVFMDADGQHDPADVVRMVEAIGEGFDLVVGARQHGSQASIGRGIANNFYNLLATFMTGHAIEDLTSGFRAVRAQKFRQFLYLLPNGFSYPTTSTMAFFRAGYSVRYLPIQAASRKGKSHISPLKDGVRFLLIIFKVAVLYSPLKLFAPLSAGFMFSGLGWYFYTYMTMSRFTNMSAMLIMASFFVLAMGLISEQITTLMYRDCDD